MQPLFYFWVWELKTNKIQQKKYKQKTEINKQSCLHIYKLNKLVRKASERGTLGKSTQNNNPKETKTNRRETKIHPY